MSDDEEPEDINASDEEEDTQEQEDPEWLDYVPTLVADFERDAEPEWVLLKTQLRFISRMFAESLSKQFLAPLIVSIAATYLGLTPKGRFFSFEKPSLKKAFSLW